ncbi:DUF4326 domain-containing protein [Methylocystis sp. SC2]|uniref:DUF4326 domain-containing protein n=1 Tax=Methylocystis sp. (strain SC2) TaxID=187303 RepID=UPI00027AEF34|nr:DUF4326 domain-containing protein [Methylocystis sp. SC2]CCJ07034.1 Conserved hypothetical protein [Methylocystis sp. SC2]
MNDAPRPVRLRLSRAKGFNLQECARSVNGLPAVNCARPGPFGNPFVIGEKPAWPFTEFTPKRVETAEEAVALFRRALVKRAATNDASIDAIVSLRGKNLACWCAMGEPCHADVLLELANLPICEEVAP